MKTWGWAERCVDCLGEDERDGPFERIRALAHWVDGGCHCRRLRSGLATDGRRERVFALGASLAPSTSLRATRGWLGVDGSALAVIFLRSAGAGRSTYDCTFYSVQVRFAKAFAPSCRKVGRQGGAVPGSRSPEHGSVGGEMYARGSIKHFE